MSKLKLFQSQKIRTVWDDEEQQWYFSVIDVVGALTDSTDAKQYIKKLRARDKELNSRWGTICTLTAMTAADGKNYRTTATTAKGLLRIIQSIPSPKAEPFKLWLAEVGAQRLEEIENPELAQERMRDTFRAKGYSDEWIALRERGIAVRGSLTDEWKDRGIQEGKEYSILTAEISKATFGMRPSEYKEYKGLKNPKDNLRDHMTDIELVLTMLGEAATTEITRTRNAQGMAENKKAAHDGGKVAGEARKNIEEQTGKSVISSTNYKNIPEKEVRKHLDKK